MKTEEDKNGNVFICVYCPKEFKYKSEKTRHELSHLTLFECETCSKKFSFISALRRHKKQHERKGSVKCEECHRKFRDEVLLKRHIKYAHKGTFVCTKCNSVYSSDVALDTHMKTHKPVSERRFKCSFMNCIKTFNFAHHLKHHELTHTNTKQHYCSICGKGFIQSHHLKTHLKSHDPAEWLFCEVAKCKKKFSSEYARKRHMITHRNKPDSGISSDSNECDASNFPKSSKNTILCTACGENFSADECLIHSKKCSKVVHNSNGEALDPTVEQDQITSSYKLMVNLKIESDDDKDLEAEENDCKMALGGCITDDNDCLCAKIKNTSSDNCDFVPIEEINVDSTKANENKLLSKPSIAYEASKQKTSKAPIKIENATDFNKNVYQPSACEGCDCANICSEEMKSDCTLNKTKLKDEPQIEHRVDGTIKIKDTFDFETDFTESKAYDGKFVPFSTCKDVIGNCLVGGNGDGCLCARMLVDEDQLMAQEIDEITPQPKTEEFV